MSDPAAKGDHLKLYCIVFAILVIVITVVAFKQKGQLEDYQQATKNAKRVLVATGRDSRGRPKGIGELAVEVEKFVKGYRESVGGDDDDGDGISVKLMQKAELSVNLPNTYAGREQDDKHPSKGYRTRSREFTYGSSTLDQLSKLVYNVEELGRYRVYEINWKLADDKVNSTPPYNRVNKSNIRVGVRLPLTKDN